jgi:D-glycero-D-manno-heptose 1,7-bisphosphate phosphatase
VPPLPTLPGPGAAIAWVFLDRDGTLNVKAPDGEYVERPEDLQLLPGAAEGVRMLNRAGVWTGVVTNQRGVALGRMSAEDLAAVNTRLTELLAEDGAALDAIYSCIHASAECDCRKPRPGMLVQARAEHPGLDFARAAIVGDSLSDIQAGSAVGLRTVLIDDGAGGDPQAIELADDVVGDMAAAASLLLGDSPRA